MYLIRTKQLPLKSLGIAYGAFTIGALFYVILIINTAIKNETIISAFSEAFFGKFAPAVLGVDARWSFFKANMALSSLNFINAVAPLALWAWITMRRDMGHTMTIAIIAITATNILFFVRYPIPDQFTFILPSLIMITIAAAVGTKILSDHSQRWHRAVIIVHCLSIALPPVTYASLPSLLKKYGFEIKRARELPFRDEMRYWIVPWKHNERSAELFARAALGEAGEHGIIVCDSTSLYPLKITQKLEQRAPAVTLYTVFEIKRLLQNHDERVLEAIKAGHVFVISPALDFVPDNLTHHLTTTREHGRILYRVVWNQESL